MKADFLRDAEATGVADYLRARAVSLAMVEARVKDEITDLMTAQVTEIVEARGLIDQPLVDLLGFVHEDPSAAFVAAVRDTVQVRPG